MQKTTIRGNQKQLKVYYLSQLNWNNYLME